jgi:hypothetical protein
MKSRLALAAAALALSLSAQAAPVNLLVNGGFEATPVANGSWVNVPSIPGWAVVEGPGTGFEVRNGAEGLAHGGNNFIELDTNGNTTIEQLLNDLTPGASYVLDFWYSPRIGQSSSTNGIRVLWDGAIVNGNITGNGGNANDWTEYSFTLVAQSGVNSLRFSAQGKSDSLGGNLDDVSLSAKPLPEPASLALVGLAVGAAGLARRRQRG